MQRVKIEWEPQLEDGAEEEDLYGYHWWEDVSKELALAIVIVSFVVSFVWTKIRATLEQRKPFADLPMPPGSHWLLGLAHQMGGLDFVPRQELLYQKYANEYGQVGFWLLNIPVVAVTHWEDAVAICNAEIFRGSDLFLRKHTQMVLGKESMMLMNGKKWRRRSATVKKALATPKALDRYRTEKVKVINTLVTSIQKRISEQEQADEKANSNPQEVSSMKFDLGELMTLYTMDVFGEVAFSLGLKSSEKLKPTPFGKAFDYLGVELVRRLYNLPSPLTYFYSLPTPSNLEHQKHRMLLRTFVSTLLNRRKQAIKSNKLTDKEKGDFLTYYVQQQAEMEEKVEDDSISDESLEDSLLGILFAGYDTTSVALSYAIYLLSQHPEIEQTVVKEAKAAKSIGDIDDLWYCRSVFMEALRLYGPVSLTMRDLQKDVPLKGGNVAPKGTKVVLPIWSINRCEHNFPRPNEFLPERWVHRDDAKERWRERTEKDDNPHVPMGNRNALFTFTAGGRSCPGRQFAMQEGVIGLAGLMKELEFSCPSDYKVEPVQLGFVQGAKGGIPITIKKRH